MHKFILNLFTFTKNLLQLFKIITVFLILMLLMIWVQDLIDSSWSWTNFVKPILNIFILAGSAISTKSIVIFDATFEYKYFWAIIFLISQYYILHLLEMGSEDLQETYNDGRRFIKKIEEVALNKTLKQEQVSEQEKIKNFKIFVATNIKKKFSHKECKVDLEEQNKIMNKFLIGKTGIVPTTHSNGFLYSFSDFNHIDEILEHFFKLIKSEAPLDYIICVQIIRKDSNKEMQQLQDLIDLKFYNKITTLSDTVWRYKFNKSHRYSVSQLGLFQKNNSTFEVHQFEEM